ncbi:hypothetical protein Q6D67_17660 [Haliea sp. E1-2-M8]|uniref:hypothetical protein n=1 Tax=Haliea sp. E1-2-M8 TaxID=3064706 RepID=UPI002728CF08|nr:hypothetical protein [Haliea sp. E1-2-M8]MDO8863529.1 hypothetical protein [Haliea sp. E1-2-M8]
MLRFLALLLLPLWVQAQTVAVPEPLRDWQEWVLRDIPEHRCPLLHSARAPQPEAWACAWPGRLELNVDSSGAVFRGAATLYAEDWLPLPGSFELWPRAVLVDGQPWPVVRHNGLPTLRLPAGTHRLEGRLDWPERPNYLPLPALYGWVALSVDGVARVAPEHGKQGLWLGLPRADTASAVPADALEIEVFRRVVDGVPVLLETRLRLTVSGALRELALGAVVPADFEAMSLTSSLEAGLHPEQGLFLLLRPGEHSVTILARARSPLPALKAITGAAPWPTSELWSYTADPALRTLELSGGRAVDPLQENIPPAWQQFPAWRLSAGEALTTELRSRGLGNTGQPRLTLRRQAWMDFHQPALHVTDTITGTTGGLQRLQQSAPWALLRAELDGVPQPLSASADGSSGVELRTVQLALEASARVPTGGNIRVSGWDQTFDRVDMTLHLPPGQILLAAPGADRAPDTWLAGWNLLDLFLVLVTGMLLGRLLGRAWGLLGLVLMALAYPDYPALLYLLGGTAAVQLLRQAVGGSGVFAHAIGVVYRGLVIGLVLVALPFVAGQLRLALFPQLELYQIDHAQPLHRSIAQTGQDMAEAAAPASAESRKFAVGEVAYSRVGPDVAMARGPLPAAEISPQALAGPGQPDWSWHRAQLSWSGPVLAEQTMRLVILPRWFTALLRVLSVLALAVLCWRWFRAQPPSPRPGMGSGATASLALVLLSTLLLAPPQASAADSAVPSPEQLQELRDWLLRPPACAPACLELPAFALTIDGTTLRLRMDVHAEADAGLALPRVQPGWQILELRVDGAEASSLRQSANQRWLWLERGVHRVELRAALTPGADRASLQFATPPRAVLVDTGPGWSAAGISAGRLAGDTLELRRETPTAGTASETPVLSRRGFDPSPFYRVERQLHLGSEWRLLTRVQRLAPATGNLVLTIPLWPGENPLDDSLAVRDGVVELTLPAGTGQRQWLSSIAPVTRLEVSAPALYTRSEQWRISSSGLWRVEASGTPLVATSDPGGRQHFRPLPGETLVLDIAAITPLEGSWLAADRVGLDIRLGARSAEYTLHTSLRATRASTHTVQLPPEAELLEASIEGRAQNLQAEDGALRLALAPGEQHLMVRWHQPEGTALLWQSAVPDLGVASANVSITATLSDRRWVLWTGGPLLGPAVLYWAALAVMLLVAFGLSRSGRTPLRLHHWLLLGLGFSTVSWPALVLVVGWLLAVDWRERNGAELTGKQRNSAQLGLGLLTVLALVVLVSVIPAGLLGQPDMQVVGNGSSSSELRWFVDRSAPRLPETSIVSAPLWVYRLAILLWAVWLASALLGWLRWTWQAMGSGGYWWRKPVVENSAAVGKTKQ